MSDSNSVYSNENATNQFGLPITSIISYMLAIISIGIGFYKMYVYNLGDTYPYEPRNAYVGGDAYNYIINAGYAEAFFILALIFVLLGSTLAIIKAIRLSAQLSTASKISQNSEQFPDLPEL
jgi:hypothetical protein